MISSTQALLLTGRLKIARSLPHAALLARELVNFRFNLGHERSEDALDWHEGPDDDLVLALAIATWQAERNPGLGFSCSYFIGRGESERPACFADLYRAAMGNCPTSWRAQPSVSDSPRKVGAHRSAPPAPLAECREGPFRVLFETAPPAAASDGKIGAGRGKLLILRRLTRDGSRDADRLLAAYSPGPPRAEPLLRGAFMEKGRLLEPKSPSGQNARLRGGTEGRNRGRDSGL